MDFVRYIFLYMLKASARVLFPTHFEWITKEPDSWKDVSVILVLNHTSLMEFLYAGGLPYSYLKEVASRLILPVADKTYDSPVKGIFFKHLASKSIRLTRKRDESWKTFIKSIEPDKDICIFMPEGRMKRKTGLDQNGNPMTVRKGVKELLEIYKDKKMVITYSQGLHHVLAPGEKFPRLGQPIHAKMEYLEINDYLNSLPNLDGETIRLDLETRRNVHCPS